MKGSGSAPRAKAVPKPRTQWKSRKAKAASKAVKITHQGNRQRLRQCKHATRQQANSASPPGNRCQAAPLHLLAVCGFPERVQIRQPAAAAAAASPFVMGQHPQSEVITANSVGCESMCLLPRTVVCAPPPPPAPAACKDPQSAMSPQ